MKVYVDANPTTIAYVTELGITRTYQLPSGYTNNEAEYRAVAFAIQDVPEATEILSDSQLIVNQLNHKYHIREDRLRLIATSIWDYIHYTGRKVIFTWIPRKENLAGKVLG